MDTCIVLSEILKENASRIEKLKKDSNFHNIPCFISNSVKEESYEKVKQAASFLAETVRDTIQYSLLESRRKRNVPPEDPIISDDIKALEDLFSYYHNAVRTTKKALPSPVSILEEWVVTYLGEMLDKGVALKIPQFLLELIKTLLRLASSLEDSYDHLVTFERGFLKIKSEILDANAITAVQDLGFHKPDYLHLASSLSHQTSEDEKTVFVTLDFASILIKRHLLKKNLKIDCCDPLYALHHLV